MNRPIARRSRFRPSRCVSAEFINEKFKELEARIDELQSIATDQTRRLATRVSALESGCAYVQSLDGS
jgi:hypothetical protein